MKADAPRVLLPTVPLIIMAMTMALLGCATRMDRAHIDWLKASRVALVVAPSFIPRQEDPNPELDAIYGGSSPWRGDRLLRIVYYSSRTNNYTFPTNIDVKAIARDVAIREGKTTLGIDLIAVERSPLLWMMGQNTYLKRQRSVLEGCTVELVDIFTESTRTQQDWMAFRNEGFSAIMVLEVLEVSVSAQRLIASIGVVLIDTATGHVVYSTPCGFPNGVYARDVSADVTAPFLPEIEHATFAWQTKDEFKRYSMAVSRQPEHSARLGAEVAALLSHAVDMELGKARP